MKKLVMGVLLALLWGTPVLAQSVQTLVQYSASSLLTDQLGNSTFGYHTDVISGINSATTVPCGPWGTTFCVIVALTGPAQFQSTGSATSPPSFTCNGAFYYQNNSFGSPAQVYIDTSFAIAVIPGVQNTLYIDFNSIPSSPFVITCAGI
jgi:hypothetical protein